MEIYKAINKIMLECGPIAKGRKNSSQGYMFRGIDDVYMSLQPLLAKYGVFTTIEVLEEKREEKTTQKGSVLLYSVLKIKYDFIAIDGSKISCTVIGEGMDSGDKSSNKAMSVAQKYAFVQLFCIPTEEPKDPENDSHYVAPKKVQEKFEPKNYLITFGKKYKGKTIGELSKEQIEKYCFELDEYQKNNGKPLEGPAAEFMKIASEYLGGV